MWGSQEKNLGQKVNVKFFRVDPYTLGNRIPRAFQNLSNIGATFILDDLVFIMDLYIYVCFHSSFPHNLLGAGSLLFREVLLAGYIHCECAPFQGKEVGRVVGWLGWQLG